MKLLLTSKGLSNKSIANALTELVAKPAKETRIAFIPTAANLERGDKDWLIMDQYRIHKLGYKVDIVELTALDNQSIEDILRASDVIFVGGGNTFYLSYWMQQRGLFALMPELLKQGKVYAGISAGSIVAGQGLVTDSSILMNQETLTDSDYNLLGPHGESSAKSLKLVELLFRPHLNSPYFKDVTPELLERTSKKANHPVYALDDNSALKIIDNSIEVVTEGQYKVYEN